MKKFICSSLFILIVVFQSIAHVQLLNPRGGETFTPDSQITIEWQEVLSHGTLNWDIMFSSDGGITWEIVEADIPNNTFSYFWIIPDTPTSEGRIKIVQDNADTDYEDISDNFIIISSVTGIDRSPEAKKINIYPNPMIDRATIEYDNPSHKSFTLTVHDINGQLIRSIRDINTNKIEIERKNLNTGLYILQLNSRTEKNYTGRFIVK
jgi:hypothetical protein